jgi:hypothetical protein
MKLRALVLLMLCLLLCARFSGAHLHLSMAPSGNGHTQPHLVQLVEDQHTHQVIEAVPTDHNLERSHVQLPAMAVCLLLLWLFIFPSQTGFPFPSFIERLHRPSRYRLRPPAQAPPLR